MKYIINPPWTNPAQAKELAGILTTAAERTQP
ncbi:hypothetical protein FRC0355_00749 [Corynebacterium diphtheriae]|nr:hypothetical protein FRC0355_00749 [Corynebacterium diphtheriae]